MTNHPNRKHTYPSHVLTDALFAMGIRTRCMWEIKGPKDTEIAWLTMYQIDKWICIVETFKGGGWEVFTPNGKNDVESKIAGVVAHCKAR